MSAHIVPVAVFRLGRIVATPNALESITQADILAGIQRHQAGDWGDLQDGDRQANNRALTKGGANCLQIPCHQRHQVLDHHRGRPFGNDGFAFRRLLIHRLPSFGGEAIFLRQKAALLSLENEVPSALPARVTKPEATRISGWTAERE